MAACRNTLKDNKVIGISDVDTRKLVRHIRTKGVMNAVISSEIQMKKELVNKAKEWDSMEGLELATKVTRKEAQTIIIRRTLQNCRIRLRHQTKYHQQFCKRGCTLRVFPAEA
jgi:carbamoyl-phosphate synthase small subunit